MAFKDNTVRRYVRCYCSNCRCETKDFETQGTIRSVLNMFLDIKILITFLEVDVNVAISKYGSEVATGTNTSHLLTGNRDLSKYSYHIINDNTGITVKLGNLYLIDNILIKLYDGDLR